VGFTTFVQLRKCRQYFQAADCCYRDLRRNFLPISTRTRSLVLTLSPPTTRRTACCCHLTTTHTHTRWFIMIHASTHTPKTSNRETGTRFFLLDSLFPIVEESRRKVHGCDSVATRLKFQIWLKAKAYFSILWTTSLGCSPLYTSHHQLPHP
jgi:hypothetical protein